MLHKLDIYFNIPFGSLFLLSVESPSTSAHPSANQPALPVDDHAYPEGPITPVHAFPLQSQPSSSVEATPVPLTSWLPLPSTEPSPISHPTSFTSTPTFMSPDDDDSVDDSSPASNHPESSASYVFSDSNLSPPTSDIASLPTSTDELHECIDNQLLDDIVMSAHEIGEELSHLTVVQRFSAFLQGSIRRVSHDLLPRVKSVMEDVMVEERPCARCAANLMRTINRLEMLMRNLEAFSGVARWMEVNAHEE